MPVGFDLDDNGDMPRMTRMLTGEGRTGRDGIIRQKVLFRVTTHRGEVLTSAAEGLDFAGWIALKSSPSDIRVAVRRTLEAITVGGQPAVSRAPITVTIPPGQSTALIGGQVFGTTPNPTGSPVVEIAGSSVV